MRNPFSFLFPKKKSTIEATPRVVNASALRSVNESDDAAFFIGAQDKSVDSYCSDGERSRLRAQCRKILLDSPWATNLARSLALSTYGTGPRLQVRTSDDELNSAVESEWFHWCKAVKYNQTFLTALQALASDGESFFHIYDNPSITNGLGLELIEPYRIREIYGTTSPYSFCGIEYNPDGTPVTYTVQDVSPNPDSFSYTFTTVPAENISHLFIPVLPCQRRGLPLLQSALHTLASLRKLEDSTLASAETASNLSFVLSTKLDPEYQSDGAVGLPALDEVPLPLEKNTGLSLPDGYSVSQLKSEQPNINLIAYQASCLTGVGASLGAPRNIALNDSSSYNYSSARLDAQLFERWTATLQTYIRPILDRHLRLVIQASRNPAINNYITAGNSIGSIYTTWFFPELTHIDRLREAQTDQLLVQNNLLTLRDYYASRGKDWKDELKQIKEEKQYLNDLGLTTEEVLK